MPGWGSFSYAFGPLVAAAMLLAIVLLMRWAFASGGSLVRPTQVRPGDPHDYGLLRAVAAPRDEDEAEAIRLALAEHGLTCTVARTTQGLRVLVWPGDADLARSIVRRLPSA